MGETSADDSNRRLDGRPDKNGTHQPGDIDGLGKLRQIIDTYNAGDADTIISVSSHVR